MPKSPEKIPNEDNGKEITIPLGPVTLYATLKIPNQAKGIVLFAHGSGSSRFSPRNRLVAHVLQNTGLATLLLDLLTPEEEEVDILTRHYRFDIELLADRLAGVTFWLKQNPETSPLQIGYFGASTGAGAALLAASRHPELVNAIVSRGGRPDLAGNALKFIKTPTLLIVGGKDYPVIELNQQAAQKISATQKLVVIPGATHLFEEPGKLEQLADLSTNWFSKYLVGSTVTPQ